VRQKEDGTVVSDVRRRNMHAPSLFHSMVYSYFLHDPRLPGRPDFVFPSRNALIEVRGCFWHRHPAPACRNATGQNAYQSVRSRSTDLGQVGFEPEQVLAALKLAIYLGF